MLNLTLTIDHLAIERQARLRVAENMTRLKQQEDRTFSIMLDGLSWPLSYDLDDQGLATIYYRGDTQGSVVRPTLKLNVGQFLLPPAEYLCLDGVPEGLNPEAQQAGFYEIYDHGLSSVLAGRIMDEIRRIGFFKAVSQKT